MFLYKWEELPNELQTPEVRFYYNILTNKKFILVIKRIFDIILSFLMLFFLFPLFFVLALAIKIDSKGPVFYRQVRMTQYGRTFKIHKFRSMVTGADKERLLTVGNDSRITRVGYYIRKYRLDEISQLIDVLVGTMTFVGPRPEVPKYVEKYTPEMMATLLLPAGVTSLASIIYKNESELLEKTNDPDKVYIEKILPEKMKYNLYWMKHISLLYDIKIMIATLFAVFGFGYKSRELM